MAFNEMSLSITARCPDFVTLHTEETITPNNTKLEKFKLEALERNELLFLVLISKLKGKNDVNTTVF